MPEIDPEYVRKLERQNEELMDKNHELHTALIKARIGFKGFMDDCYTEIAKREEWDCYNVPYQTNILKTIRESLANRFPREFDNYERRKFWG